MISFTGQRLFAAHCVPQRKLCGSIFNYAGNYSCLLSNASETLALQSVSPPTCSYCWVFPQWLSTLLSLSLWKSHLLTRKDSQLFYDGHTQCSHYLLFSLPSAKTFRSIKSKTNHLKSHSFQMEVKSNTHPPLLKTVGTIFFVLFLNISLSSLVPHWIWHLYLFP